MHVSNWVWGGRCEYPDVGNQGIWVIRSGHQDIIKPVRVSCWGFFFPFFFLPFFFFFELALEAVEDNDDEEWSADNSKSLNPSGEP